MEGLKVPQCSGLLAHRVCYRLGGSTGGVGSAPRFRTIQVGGALYPIEAPGLRALLQKHLICVTARIREIDRPRCGGVAIRYLAPTQFRGWGWGVPYRF